MLFSDLFHQSISESGSALSYWGALSDLTITTTKRFAEAAHCTGADSAAVVKCLQKLSTTELQRIQDSIAINSTITSTIGTWSFRVDGELFTQADLKEIDSEKPAIIGVNSMEMPVPDRKFFLRVLINDVYFEEKQALSANDIPNAQAVWKRALDHLFPGNNTVKNEVLKLEVNYVYLDSKGDRNNNTFVIQQANKVS